MALNAKPDRPNSDCCLALLSTVPQMRYGASGRKPAQTRQIFLVVESTEAQPRATDRHREAPMRLDSNTPKNRLLPLGAMHPPFSSGSVRAQKEGGLINGILLHCYSPARPAIGPTTPTRALCPLRAPEGLFATSGMLPRPIRQPGARQRPPRASFAHEPRSRGGRRISRGPVHDL